MQLHGYPYAPNSSTVIVEMREEVWQSAGFDGLDETGVPPPAAPRSSPTPSAAGRSGPTSRRGPPSARSSTNAGRTATSSCSANAAHTAHFSIGSGTKLAVEDALALAACLQEQPSLQEALGSYEEERRPVVASTQRAAKASLEWFEDLERYLGLPPRQFAFNLLTRSRRVTHENLRLRDADFTGAVEREFGCPPGSAPDVHPVPAARG
ncbi:bifunctional salicylyl-CoA 5-hydroxylase/oxidoreductase [Streptomyces violaceorubidus]